MAAFLSNNAIEEVVTIFRVILDIRRAVDLPFTSPRDQHSFERQRDLLNDFEALRFTLRTLTRNPRRHESSDFYVVSESIRLIDKILQNDRFHQISNRKFRAISAKQPSSTQLAFPLEDEDISIGEALILSHHRLSNILPDQQSEIEFSPSNFRSIIPKQIIAPTQFKIENDRIFVNPQPAAPLPISSSLIDPAAGELEEQAEDIIADLESSNCHPRLLRAFRALREGISGRENIIRVGLGAITCRCLVDQFAQEIPDATLAMMRGHLKGIEMFVGQFEEWHKFCENSATASLDTEALGVLDHASEQIARILENNVQLADPQVPKTINFLRECINSPTVSAKRSGLAALSTLENLVSCIFSYSSDFIDESIRASIKSASIAIGGVVGLTVLGLLSAELIAPVAGSTVTGQWIIEAIKMLRLP